MFGKNKAHLCIHLSNEFSHVNMNEKKTENYDRAKIHFRISSETDFFRFDFALRCGFSSHFDRPQVTRKCKKNDGSELIEKTALPQLQKKPQSIFFSVFLSSSALSHSFKRLVSVRMCVYAHFLINLQINFVRCSFQFNGFSV